MTCQTTQGADENVVPSSFMDLLLDGEDEDDLDWLATEAPSFDMFPEETLQMSPDGPHAYTRRRVLCQEQVPTPPESPLCSTPDVLAPIHPAPTNSSCLNTSDNSHVAAGVAPPFRLSEDLETGAAVVGQQAEVAAQPCTFTHSHLRQIYAQVQAHAQLLLQSCLLASQGQISVLVSRDVQKLWGWTDESLRSGPLRDEQVRSSMKQLRQMNLS